MELRHLRYFVAVAEELNLTHAAERLRVAQPALSRQIKDLEEELGTRLFERRPSGVQMTRAGKVFFQHARSILAQAHEAAEQARTASGLMTGTLSMGFPAGLPLSFLGPAIARFRKSNPKVVFEFHHEMPDQQLKAIREGRLDVGLIMSSRAHEGLEHLIIWRLPFAVVLPKSHRLARRARFDIADLKGEDFVFCTRESRPEFYDDFFRHCANAGFRPHIVKEIGGYPTNMLGLVSVGVGLSVLPHFPQVERIPEIVYRPLVRPKMYTDFSLIWKQGTPSRVVLEFISTCEKQFPLPPDQDRAEL